MTDRELMQMALDALDSMNGTQFLCDAAHHPKKDRHEIGQRCPVAERYKATREALRAQLAQPEPDFSKAGFGKPQGEEGCAGCGKKASKGWALYCVKCTEREWKWLTDEEIEQIVDTHWNDPSMFVEAIEAKLKEKNHDS